MWHNCYFYCWDQLVIDCTSHSSYYCVDPLSPYLKLAYMPPKHTHSLLLVSKPGAEARGTLGFVPTVLSWYIILSDYSTVSSHLFLLLRLPSTLCNLSIRTILSIRLHHPPPSPIPSSMSSFYHNCRDTHAPGRRYADRRSFSIGRVAI